MVSFQCESCGDVLTKKKLDAHVYRCRDASFTCLDCHTQFWGQDYKGHTSCISEDQKYQGALYKEKKPKPQQYPHQQQQNGSNGAPRTPYQAYVKDAEDEPSPIRDSLIQLNVPPPAPTPPSAAIPPVNVFDFLVKGSASPSAASSVSSFPTGGEDSDVEMSPEVGRSQVSSGPPSSRGQSPVNGHPPHEEMYSYGSGPVEVLNQHFDSEYDLNMQLQRVAVPPAAPTPPTAIAQSPALPNLGDYSTEHPKESRSDKKRKRPNIEDLDTSRATGALSTLHSGLTGGLTRLLSSSKDRQVEASPLSPKKRSKRASNGDASQTNKHRDDDHRSRRRKEKEKRRSLQNNEDHRERRREPKLLEGRKDLKAIEYHSTSKEQEPGQCNSEFFLSLVDKDHRSIKGQSLWGVLKMFHEGRGAAGRMDTDDDEAKQSEERKLLKGLRVKRSKAGELVLFSRPEAEIEV